MQAAFRSFVAAVREVRKMQMMPIAAAPKAKGASHRESSRVYQKKDSDTPARNPHASSFLPDSSRRRNRPVKDPVTSRTAEGISAIL